MGMFDKLLESLFLKTGQETADRMAPLVQSTATVADEKAVVHHVTNGGCFDHFAKAMGECHPSPPTSVVQRGEHVVDAKACVQATAALRKCFTRNPAMFKHMYLRVMDECLDHYLKPSPGQIAIISDETVVLHHVANGGCAKDLATAIRECQPSPPKELIEERGDATNRVVDVNACVMATAALRKCFASNPAMFKHQYLHRMDQGLDQDWRPTSELVKEEENAKFRWWTGMRRS
ncbi:unnamed protein product [Triticum turgidum subsp. durum]|uniref:Uncharacterized protein n=1 Tax=Triticum turgidum subsp. durum TaxID=4567 RepID=A0A9R0WYA3_TRITD|nr:unnamed protein product [Triticum turgidum subsp. durum]